MDTEKLRPSIDGSDESIYSQRSKKVGLGLAVAVGVVCIGYPIAIGAMGGLAVGNVEDIEWYKNVKKAPWTPPAWVFGVVWTILYLLMGTASYLLWVHSVKRGVAITLPALMYAIQLLLNGLWFPIFFGNAWFKLGLADLILLFTAVVACIFQFWRVSRAASAMMMPYALWLIVALSLNTYVAIYNHDGKNQLMASTTATEPAILNSKNSI